MSFPSLTSPPKKKKLPNLSVPFDLIEAVNSPTYAEFRNRERSNQFLQKHIENGRLMDSDQTPKVNQPILEYEREFQQEKRIGAWLSPKKVKGSMFCAELWTKNQMLDVRKKTDCLSDKSLLKKIAKESTRPSQKYNEDLDKHFIKNHPDYAEATELMKKVVESNGVTGISNMNLFNDPLVALNRNKSNRINSKKLPSLVINTELSSNSTAVNTPDTFTASVFSLNRLERATLKKKTLENIYGKGNHSPTKKSTQTAKHLEVLGLSNGANNKPLKSAMSPKNRQIKVKIVLKENDKAKSALKTQEK